MNSDVYYYNVLIKETYLDIFGHVNNAMYLTLFEEARWDLITKRGYGVEKIKATGLGPTILELKLSYLKELRLREQIVIETEMIAYEGKIGRIAQRMVRDGEVCCKAEFTFGLFSVRERRLVDPTEDWLKAVGIE